jgi:hypothetical protein
LKALLNEPVPNHEAVERSLGDWLTALLCRSEGSSPTPLGQTWLEILHTLQREGWNKIQAKAVGRWAATDAAQLTAMLQDLMHGSSDRLQQNLHALRSSVEFGAGPLLIHCLKAIPLEEIAEENFYALSKLLTQCVPSLCTDEQDDLATWLSPLLEHQIEQFYKTLDTLADQSLIARSLLTQHIPRCSAAKQAQIQYRLLRFQPIEQHPPLDAFDKAAQRFLIEFYRQQARTDALARDRLLTAATARSKTTALAASNNIALILGDALAFTDLMPLLNSPFQGVRANGLAALIHQIEQSRLATTEDIDRVCILLSGENDQTVVRLLLDLIAIWARQNQRVSPHMLEALSTLPPRLSTLKLFEGGTARSLLDALKASAQSNAPPDPAMLSQTTQYLLTVINLAQLRNGESEMIDLLCAVNRLDASFLQTVVQQQGASIVQRNWMCNFSALMWAIDRVEGQNSALFAQILTSPWCTPTVSHLILEIQSR